MKRLSLLTVLLLVAVASSLWAAELKPRLRFEKHLWADGVDSKARYLDRLVVKFFDEDMVRLRDGQLISTNGRTSLGHAQDFLARHPEIRPGVMITTETEDEHAARLALIEERSGKDLVDMFSFYIFRLPTPAADPKALLADILRAPEVETAYYEPIPYDMTCTDVGVVTPNLIPYQDFKDSAPLGVDLPYANTAFTLEVCDGATTTDIGIFERGLQTTHEDFTTATVRTAGTPDTDNDHGTAVSGIIGACDENNVGTVGFVADEGVRLYQRNSGSYPSVADIYNLANSQLVAGEITNSSWGYFSSPMPPGQSCPCNPGQNGMVPIEYNAGVKAEIDAGTAAGIHYFLAAGNGCTDLNAAIFGATFDYTTGSVYVGAIESTGDHDAACFTNFGSRLTSCAWGENVTTLGYDNHNQFPGGHIQNEWYTDSFNGTSSASPIVCGVAGVLNNIYRDINAGANISTTTMRSWLTIGATPPGDVTPGTIGSMPNLFGITSPNLNPDIRTGWTDYIVPRNSGDATGSSCTLPATLVSDPDTTFLNSEMENTSNFGTATPAEWDLYRDDVREGSYYVIAGQLGPLGQTYYANDVAYVRGGRHTMRSECDPDLQVAEYYESDNRWVEQYVWNPRPLTAESPLELTQPPLRLVTGQTGIYYNGDGYTLSSSFTGLWDLMGVMSSTTAADYDTRVYSEAITSQNGFDDYEAWSGSVGPVDIVGKNQHNVGGTALAAVINWDGENDDYNVEGETSTSAGTPGYGRTSAGSFTISANELMEAVEFNVDALVPYEIEADVTTGTANVVISIFGPDDDYFALSNRNAFANANGAGGDEHVCFTPAATGYHLALIHKYDSNDWNETSSFTLYIGKGQFDLTHNLNTGWSHTIVVRQVSGGMPAVLPATLTGNVATNYLNAGLMNVGCVTSPTGLNNAFYLDGPLAYTTGSLVQHAPGVEGWVTNQGPIFVFGGRHNVGEVIDVNGEGAEWREDNNRHDEQFVWTPFNMSNQSYYMAVNPAPNFRNTESSVVFTGANQDGWRFTGSARWVGVAATPQDADDDYNVHLYNPSTGSEDGFETRHIPSWMTEDGITEFAVENGNLNGAVTLDMGVCNNFQYPSDPSQDGYWASQCNSIADLAMNAANGPYTMSNGRPIHVFDLNLTSGTNTRIILDNMSTVNLGLAIFDPTLNYGSRSNNGTIINANGDAGDETTVYNATNSGRHGIVVFKNDYSDATTIADYRLIVGTRTPAVPLRFVIQVLNSMVDPIQMRAHWDSVTTDANGAAMNVDQYQLFYTLDPNLVGFPAGWVSYIITPLATQDFGVSTTVGYFRMLVVAQDSDGYILAHSPLPDGSDVTGMRLPTPVSAPGAGSQVIGDPSSVPNTRSVRE